MLSLRSLLPALVRAILIAAWIVLCALPAVAQQTGHDPASMTSTEGSDASAIPRWFAIEALNPGLGPVPEALDRSTPRAAMESFLHLAEGGDLAAAAHLLDLAPVPVDEQAQVGPERAGTLARVMERRVSIDWSRLVDRPDGLNDQATGDRAVGGEPRRSILVARVDTEGRDMPLRLNRVRPEGGEPVWVFSRQSVADLPRLAAATEPSTLESMMPERLRQESPILGLFWWELIVLPVLAGLSLLAALCVARGIGRLSPGPHRPRLHALIRSVRLPVTLLVTSLILWLVAGPLLTFSARVNMLLWPVIAAGFAMAALTFLINTIDRVIDRLQSTNPDDLAGSDPEQDRRREIATTVSAARRIAIVIALIAGVAGVLAASDAFSTAGWSLVAFSGALTLVIGFAARHALANILGSLQIALNGSAKIGDELLFKGYMCHVERINFTFVQLRVWSGERLVVPVTDFVEEIYENWTLRDGYRTGKITLKLAAAADIEALREVYHRVLDDGPWELGDRNRRGVYVTGQDVFGIDVMFCVPTVDAEESWAITCDVRERLLAEIATLAREEGGAWLAETPRAAEAA